MAEFYLKDDSLRCEMCASDEVLYKNITSVKDGFAKAEIWGVKDEHASMSRAQCQTCKHEWDFESF